MLVIGQVPGDASLRGLDINLWLLDTCRSIRAITDRPIVLRPHPLAYGETAAAVAGALAEIGVTLDVPAKPLSVTLRSAWVTVTHSSGAAIDSVLAGVPAIALSPASFAWDVTDHDLTAVVSPRLYERESWLDKLGAAQWSQEELAQGVLWQPLLEACHAFLLQSVALD